MENVVFGGLADFNEGFKAVVEAVNPGFSAEPEGTVWLGHILESARYGECSISGMIHTPSVNLASSLSTVTAQIVPS